MSRVLNLYNSDFRLRVHVRTAHIIPSYHASKFLTEKKVKRLTNKKNIPNTEAKIGSCSCLLPLAPSSRAFLPHEINFAILKSLFHYLINLSSFKEVSYRCSLSSWFRPSPLPVFIFVTTIQRSCPVYFRDQFSLR